ncbi:MAG: matrixin family metalloprotease [Euryarchaeota archaeon]|nr:matrixin family metalloprotease [Euryarchaeota archaeon]
MARHVLAAALLLAVVLSGCSQSPQAGPVVSRVNPEATPEAPLPPPSDTPLTQRGIRWNHMPLTVYLSGDDPGYMEDTWEAFRMWENATGGLVSFRRVEDRRADITVIWPPVLSRVTGEHGLGNANTHFETFGPPSSPRTAMTSAVIELLTQSQQGAPLTHMDMTNVALHEIGHSLGLDHSTYPRSVMFTKVTTPSVSVNAPLEQDVAPLLPIYREKPRVDLLIAQGEASRVVQKVLTGDRHYLNIQFTVRNDGFLDSPPAELRIQADGRTVDERKTQEMKFGQRLNLSLRNVLAETAFQKVTVEVDPDNRIPESDETNNRLTLEVPP